MNTTTFTVLRFSAIGLLQALYFAAGLISMKYAAWLGNDANAQVVDALVLVGAAILVASIVLGRINSMAVLIGALAALTQQVGLFWGLPVAAGALSMSLPWFAHEATRMRLREDGGACIVAGCATIGAGLFAAYGLVLCLSASPSTLLPLFMLSVLCCAAPLAWHRTLAPVREKVAMEKTAESTRTQEVAKVALGQTSIESGEGI